MITVKMDEQYLIDELVERVKYWTQDEEEISLFEKMYDDYVWNGVFTDSEVDIMQIVDNDWVNYTAIIRPDDTDFEKLLKVYKEQGLGDCSCEDFDEYKIKFIEAVNDDEEPSMFLVRL